MRRFFKDDMKASLRIQLLFIMILLYWEVMLYYQLHSTLSGIALWNVLFMLPIGIALSVFAGWSRNHQRANEMFMIVLLLIVSVFYLGDLIYFKTFGSLVSVSMLGAGEDAVTNFWWSMKTTLKDNAAIILLFEAPVLLEIFLALKNKRKKEGFGIPAHLFTAFLAVGLWALVVISLPLAGKSDYSAYGAYHSRYIDTDSASRKLGVLPNFLVELRYSLLGSNGPKESLAEASVVELKEEEPKEEVRKVEFNSLKELNFRLLAGGCEDEEVRDLLNYMASQEVSEKNEYTGLFEGYNLIYICAESFSSLAIDETITPTLYKMANNGIVLNNYYNSFRNTTTNGEYAILTGVWPDVARQSTNMGKITGTMGRSIGKDMTPALGNTFALSEGLQPRAYHNYLGYYYGRNKTLPNMGFDCQFMNDGMEFTTAWPASDLEMLEQSVDDYLNDDRFLTYYMTFSGHGNYTTDNVMVAKNIKTVTSKLSEHLPSSAEGYLAANYELEEAMAYLLERLQGAGKLDNTVIVIAGDHYPYYLTDAGYMALKGEAVDEDFESFHSSCIIYNAGLKQKIEVDTPCCNVDIIPTIYNLFGVTYDSRLYAGTDIFGSGMHIAQLYNKNFITDKVKYNAATGKAEWLVDTSEYSEEKLNSYLESAINTVKNRYAFSIGVEDTDLYSYVFDNYDLNIAYHKEEEIMDVPVEEEVNIEEKAEENLG